MKCFILRSNEKPEMYHLKVQENWTPAHVAPIPEYGHEPTPMDGARLF